MPMININVDTEVFTDSSMSNLVTQIISQTASDALSDTDIQVELVGKNSKKGKLQIQIKRLAPGALQKSVSA
jgi:hypothetical protein